MNVSDLQTVLGLSYSSNSSTLSENKETDYSSHGSAPAASAGSGSRCRRAREALTSDLLCVFRSEAENEPEAQHGEPGADDPHPRQDERKSVSLDASGVWSVSSSSFCPSKGQKWSSDILTKQSKPSWAKSSSKLFFVSRLRGKKYKTSGSTKVLQDTSNTLDAAHPPTQGPQKVASAGGRASSRLARHIAAVLITAPCFPPPPFLPASASVPTCSETKDSSTC